MSLRTTTSRIAADVSIENDCQISSLSNDLVLKVSKRVYTLEAVYARVVAGHVRLFGGTAGPGQSSLSPACLEFTRGTPWSWNLHLFVALSSGFSSASITVYEGDCFWLPSRKFTLMFIQCRPARHSATFASTTSCGKTCFGLAFNRHRGIHRAGDLSLHCMRNGDSWRHLLHGKRHTGMGLAVGKRELHHCFLAPGSESLCVFFVSLY